MKILFIACSLLLFSKISTAQTVTVIDHRGGKDTVKPTNVIDHRIVRDMSPGLVKPVFEEMPVYRIQLRITTSDNNGTDDAVWVELNEEGHRFYLAKGIDNFQPRKTVTYDVVDADIKKLKDIRFLKFGVKGEDGPCFKKIELIVNNSGTPIYATPIVTNAGTCFDNNNNQVAGNLTVTYNNLRRHSYWNYNGPRANIWRPVKKINKEWIVSLIEACIGNQMVQEGSNLKWGSYGGVLENNTLFGDAVEVKYKNSHTLSVDLDLERDITGSNPEADIKFELDFRCNDGVINIETQNVTVNTNGVGAVQDFIRTTGFDLISIGIGLFAAPAAATPLTIGAWFSLRRAIAFSVKLNPGAPTTSNSCNQTIVSEAGDILLKN
jgi:hypothetical protein